MPWSAAIELKPLMKIQDCVALVTGSNRGLGFAFCEGLLRVSVRTDRATFDAQLLQHWEDSQQ
jgi:NAD(P)-dependent dehydrogenase (short-subunit alcohol dehydrogenase family)